MVQLLRNMALGTVLSIGALVVSGIVTAGSSIRLSWHEVALVALGVGIVIVLALALPFAVFRPFGWVGFALHNAYLRTAPIERHQFDTPQQVSNRHAGILWNLIPLTAVIAVVTGIAIAF